MHFSFFSIFCVLYSFYPCMFCCSILSPPRQIMYVFITHCTNTHIKYWYTDSRKVFNSVQLPPFKGFLYFKPQLYTPKKYFLYSKYRSIPSMFISNTPYRRLFGQLQSGVRDIICIIRTIKVVNALFIW